MPGIKRRALVVGGVGAALAALAPGATTARAAVPPRVRVTFTDALAEFGTTAQTVYRPAVPPRTGFPGPGTPAFTEVQFSGYPVVGDLLSPRIEVRPTDDLAGYDLDRAMNDLLALLDDHPDLAAEDSLPFLPPRNAAQLFHARERYLDTGNGVGIRYLTYYTQNGVSVPSNAVFYTCQARTNDGAYHIAAAFPVEVGPLPLFDDRPGGQAFPIYAASVRARIDALERASILPLPQLDDLMESLIVG